MLLLLYAVVTVVAIAGLCACRYTAPDFLYVRSWLPCIFFSGGITMGNIGRQLALVSIVPQFYHSSHVASQFVCQLTWPVIAVSGAMWGLEGWRDRDPAVKSSKVCTFLCRNTLAALGCNVTPDTIQNSLFSELKTVNC